jgi:hypothetical protein
MNEVGEKFEPWSSPIVQGKRGLTEQSKKDRKEKKGGDMRQPPVSHQEKLTHQVLLNARAVDKQKHR